MSIQFEYEVGPGNTTSIPFQKGSIQSGLISKQSEGGSFSNDFTSNYSVSVSAEAEASSAKESAALAQTALNNAILAKDAAISARDLITNLIPTGGAEDNLLVKASGDDYALEWTDTIDSANVDGGYF